MLLIHQAINAIGELVLALTIPFLWWLIVTRRQVRFDRWLGFFLPPVQRTWLTTVIVVLFTLLLAIPPAPDYRPRDLGHLRFQPPGFCRHPGYAGVRDRGDLFARGDLFPGLLTQAPPGPLRLFSRQPHPGNLLRGGPRPLAGGRWELAGHPDHRPNRNGDWLLPGLAQRTL